MVVLNGANNNFLIQKKDYGSASEAFLRSETALKIPVRKGSAYKLVWQLGLFIYYFLCSCTVYTLHTGSRRRADRPVFSVILHLHKTQINTTMELNIRENNQNNNMVDNM